MRGHWYKTTVMLTMVLMLAGCGGDGAEAEQTAQTEQVEQTEQTLEQVLEEHFLAAEDAEDDKADAEGIAEVHKRLRRVLADKGNAYLPLLLCLSD